MEVLPDDEKEFEILKKVRAMMEVEIALTATIEKVEPWLTSSTRSPPLLPHGDRPRVRPLPTTMEQVEHVLAVARNFASRTSAPAGWNPNAPVMGFSTPNPLPHQLRGGALAALQLERARQAERERKRQRQLEKEESTRKQEEQQQLEEMAAQGGGGERDEYGGGGEDMAMERDPKRREVTELDREMDRAEAMQRQQRMQQQQQKVMQQRQDVSMNLSDSSSDEDD